VQEKQNKKKRGAQIREMWSHRKSNIIVKL